MPDSDVDPAEGGDRKYSGCERGRKQVGGLAPMFPARPQPGREPRQHCQRRLHRQPDRITKPKTRGAVLGAETRRISLAIVVAHVPDSLEELGRWNLVEGKTVAGPYDQ